MSGQLSARPVPLAASSRWSRLVVRLDRSAGAVFILPAVLVILIFSIFPLLASLYVSLTRLSFSEGGIHLTFVGLGNYAKLVIGIDRTHFIGVTVPLTPLTAAVLFVVYGGFAFLLVRYLRGPGRTVLGFVGRLVTAVIAGALVWLVVDTVMTSGRPGTLAVTLIYVCVDVSVQYLLAVGVAYLFRMLTDTSKGPLYPLWAHFGLTDVSWVTNPWGARLAVMIGDVWQWTPFIFIILLAAIETLPHELVEAAVADGANRWQVFWRITFPQILPATTTVVLIRIIE